MGSYKELISSVMTTFVIVNAIALAARVYVRLFIVNAFGHDDWMLLLTYVVYTVACGFGWRAIAFGFAADKGEAHPWFDTDKLMNAYYVDQILLYIASGLVKITIAIVLYRLAPHPISQAVMVTCMVIFVVWTFITTIFASDLCATAGSANYAGSGVCNAVGYFRMISEMVFDFFLALYPVPMLWRSAMSRRMKFIVCGLLGLGFVSATIAKLVVLVRMLRATVPYEISNYHYQLLMWADVELGLSILAAALAGLRPLARILFGRRRLPVNNTAAATAAMRARTAAGLPGRPNTTNNVGIVASGSTVTATATRPDRFAGGAHHVEDEEDKDDEGYELAPIRTRATAATVEDDYDDEQLYGAGGFRYHYYQQHQQQQNQMPALRFPMRAQTFPAAM